MGKRGRWADRFKAQYEEWCKENPPSPVAQTTWRCPDHPRAGAWEDSCEKMRCNECWRILHPS